ncbi:9_t:CDS:2, partial [Ambispora leptoticha]
MSFIHVNPNNKLSGNKPRGGKRVMKIHPTASATMNQQQPIVVLLQPLNNTFTTKKFVLSDKEKVKIGRQTNAKTTPSENNGYFDSKVLSRTHAEVWNDRGKVYIKDLKSSNGTFVNNHRLSPEGSESEPKELHHEDILEFGIDILGDDNHTIMYKKVSAKVLTSGLPIDPNNISSGDDQRGVGVQKNGSLVSMINSSLEREIMNSQETNRLLKNIRNKIDAFGDRLAEKNVEVKTEEAAELKRKQSLTSLLSNQAKTRSNSLVSNGKPPIPPEDDNTATIINGELNPSHKSILLKAASSRSSLNSIDLDSKLPIPIAQHDDNKANIVNGNENSESKSLLSRPRSNSFGTTRIPVFSQAGNKDSVLVDSHGASAANTKSRPRSNSVIMNGKFTLKKNDGDNNNTSIISMNPLVELNKDSLKLIENGINNPKVLSGSDEEPIIAASLSQDDEKMTFVVHKNGGRTESPDKLEDRETRTKKIIEDQTKGEADIHFESENLTKQDSPDKHEMNISKSNSRDINEQVIASKSIDDPSNTNSSSIILKGKGKVEEVQSNLSENSYNNSPINSVMTILRNSALTPNFDNDDSVVISKVINSIITPNLQNPVDKGAIIINSKEIKLDIRGSPSSQPRISKIPRRKSIEYSKETANESRIINDHILFNDKSSSMIRRHSFDSSHSAQPKDTSFIPRRNSLNSHLNVHSSNNNSSESSFDVNFVNFKKETRQRLAEIKRAVDSDDNNKKIASLSRELKTSTIRVNDLSVKLTEMDKRCQSYAIREKELRESLDTLKKSFTEIQESRSELGLRLEKTQKMLMGVIIA